MGVGVASDGQRVFELSYPLAHLSDLTMELLRVGEDEPGAVQSNGDMAQRNGHSPRAMAGAQRT